MTWLKRLLLFAGRVLRSFLRNRRIARGVGYNALLSLVPFLTLTVVRRRVAEMARHVGVSRPKLYRLLWSAELDPARFRARSIRSVVGRAGAVFEGAAAQAPSRPFANVKTDESD